MKAFWLIACATSIAFGLPDTIAVPQSGQSANTIGRDDSAITQPATHRTANKSSAKRKNKLTVINGTQDVVIVKIKNIKSGITDCDCEIPSGDSCLFNLANGTYRDVIKHRSKDGVERYSKGEGFNVSSPKNQYSVLHMTIQGVVEGKYRSEGASKKDFEE